MVMTESTCHMAVMISPIPPTNNFYLIVQAKSIKASLVQEKANPFGFQNG
jgi:hypothetical protein